VRSLRQQATRRQNGVGAPLPAKAGELHRVLLPDVLHEAMDLGSEEMILPKKLKKYAMLVGKLTRVQDDAKAYVKDYIK